MGSSNCFAAGLKNAKAACNFSLKTPIWLLIDEY
jgi:hypothetical protein